MYQQALPIKRARIAVARSTLVLDHLQRTVLESVQSVVRGADQADDTTLLLVRYRAVSHAAASSVQT
jgi:hypothetical protein